MSARKLVVVPYVVSSSVLGDNVLERIVVGGVVKVKYAQRNFAYTATSISLTDSCSSIYNPALFAT